VASEHISRHELIICTKGRVLPCPHPNHADWFYQHYVKPNNSSVTLADLAEHRYCIHPEYRDQPSKGLATLGIQTIDVYYIHNPEKPPPKVEADIFYNQLRTIFEIMEDAVLVGKIANYGLATWNAFRVPPTQSDHINLSRAKSIAREVAGNRDDHFRFIHFPLNMAMPEALRFPTRTTSPKLCNSS